MYEYVLYIYEAILDLSPTKHHAYAKSPKWVSSNDLYGTVKTISFCWCNGCIIPLCLRLWFRSCHIRTPFVCREKHMSFWTNGCSGTLVCRKVSLSPNYLPFHKRLWPTSGVIESPPKRCRKLIFLRNSCLYIDLPMRVAFPISSRGFQETN